MLRWCVLFVVVVATAAAGTLSAAEKSSEIGKDKAPPKPLPLSGEVFLVGRVPRVSDPAEALIHQGDDSLGLVRPDAPWPPRRY